MVNTIQLVMRRAIAQSLWVRGRLPGEVSLERRLDC